MLTPEQYHQLLVHSVDDEVCPSSEPPEQRLYDSLMAEFGYQFVTLNGKSAEDIYQDYVRGLPPILTTPFMDSDILKYLTSVAGKVPEYKSAAIAAYWQGLGAALNRIREAYQPVSWCKEVKLICEPDAWVYRFTCTQTGRVLTLVQSHDTRQPLRSVFVDRDHHMLPVPLKHVNSALKPLGKLDKDTL